MPKILYFNEEVTFHLKNKRQINRWIISTIESEGRIVGNINYIFCSDKYLHKLNVTFLGHDNLTDIITFPADEDKISGDIFISIERITENSNKFNLPFSNELFRVMIHGVLHLLGYKDKKKEEKIKMTSKEDYCLSLLPHFIR